MTNPAANKKQLPAFLVLTIIAVIAAVALAVTNQVTRGPIAENAAKARREAFSAVLAADSYDELAVPADSGVSSLVVARNDGTPVEVLTGATVTSKAVFEAVNAAVASETLTATATGFQSEVTATVKLNENKEITDLTLNTAGETTGFGTRCGEDAAFIDQFVGKAGPFVKADEIGVVGYCVVASAQGYAGPVAVTLGVDLDGTVTGAKIGDTSFAETAGFGMKWKDDADRAEQFKGIVIADGGMIEAVTGATLTSNAVLSASNTGLSAVDQVLHGVTVTATLNEDGSIATLTVDASTQTNGLGTRCAEEAFTSQFIGKIAPFTLGEGIDAVAGATVTSQAVVNAVNSITADQLTVIAPAYGVRMEPALVFGKKVVAYADSVPAGEYAVTGKGFQSEVKVNFTVDENSTITALTIDSTGETKGYGTRCTEDAAFQQQFIGAKVPVLEGVDVLSGATITSTAIIDAINSVAATGEDAAASAEEPAVEASAPVEEAAAPAGETKTGKAQGFQSEVTVTLTVDAGVITAIKVDSSDETPGFGTRCGEDEAFLAQFVGKKATPDLGEGIDALSGATVTSGAVIEAANAAIGVETGVVEVTEEVPSDETLTASAKGLLSDVTVTITLNADGTIATMAVDASGETAAIAGPCTEEAFLSNFIGKAGPFEGVEVVSGATYTSNAVINAVNSLFAAE